MDEARFCFRHPTERTKRKCFTCDRPICARCQFKIDHHLFCNHSCHDQYQNYLPTGEKIKYKRYAIYTILVLLLGGFLYFALLADAFYSGGNGVKATTDSIAITPSLPVAIEEEEGESILIERPANGSKTLSERIEVEGPAPHNSVVAMYLNGTLIGNTVANDGRYRFSDVTLTKATNVLQTRFYATNGSSDSSPAIMIFYRKDRQSNQNVAAFFQNSTNNIVRGDPSRRLLALTFDGSSDANSAESILKSLDQSNIRTTIFLSHRFIQQYPEITVRIAAKHEVGNLCEPDTHEFNEHQSVAGEITRQELQDQLQKTETLFQQVTGREITRYWRCSSDQKPEILNWGAELGYTHVAWTVDSETRQNMDSLDWIEKPDLPGYFPARLIKDRLLSFGQNERTQANGSIILMHLGSRRGPDDRLERWLPEIINTFRRRGYQFATITELMPDQNPARNSMQSAAKVP